MLKFASRIDYDRTSGIFTLRLVGNDGQDLATHSATAKRMDYLARGLDVQAYESRESGGSVNVVLPSHDDPDQGYEIRLTPRSAEILADKIRFHLLEVAVEMKHQKRFSKPTVIKASR